MNWGEAGYIRIARARDEGEKCGLLANEEDDGSITVTNETVCGTCGILADPTMPLVEKTTN